MSFSGQGFPGGMGAMPGAPGVVPGGQAAGGFVLDIPADPNWEPFEQDDVLEMDGYYAGRIKSERFVEGKNGKAGGVWIAVELLDDDVRGKSISKQLADPRAATKDMWFMWRGMMRSIYGLDGARSAQRYTLGSVTNAPVYIRTGIYISNDGSQRTGIDNWCTKEEYDKALSEKKHRWTPKPRNAGGAGMTGPGALPTGLPPAFPGMGQPLPGAPSAPVGFPTSTPQPASAAPMQPAPQQQMAPTPQHTAPPPAWGGGAPTGPAQPPPAQTATAPAAWNQGAASGFQPPAQQTAQPPVGGPPQQGFAPPAQLPQQGFAPPPAATGFAPPPVGAAPQPGGGSAFPGFPGGPPPVYPQQ